ncbi:hypothetical protein [Micromonospora sp. NPDC005174]|uniref:hypothetical protein n=1 Tax=Micromonospora sp. NPDC005174 TaxID=3157018 RepID=UPI0033AAA5E0
MARILRLGPTTAQLVGQIRAAGTDWAPALARFLTINADALTAELSNAADGVNERDYAALMRASREVTTHYKWLIAAGDGDRWKVWLHQYKDDAVTSGSYADVPHDHRYNFVSLILSGGYDNVDYKRPDGAEAPLPDGSRTVLRGSAISLHHRQIHSLAHIRPGTLSLFLQGRTEKSMSSSYRSDGTERRHESLETVFDRLRQHLNDSA